MAYIEKDRDGEFWNPVSQTTPINPDCDCNRDSSTTTTSDHDTNLARWKWLIEGWDKMTFVEKAALFTPYVRVVRLYNTKSVDFDTDINKEIIDTVFTKCRAFKELKYDEDHHGSPCFTLIFSPIDVNSIPDTTTRLSVQQWGTTYGFLENTSSTVTCSCMHS